MEYAELQCKTNFSFLEGAGHPEEMVARGAELGLRAIAVVDRNGLSGIVRAHAEAKERSLPLIIGATLTLEKQDLVFLVRSRKGYANLCRLISLVRQRDREAPIELTWEDLSAHHDDLLLCLPPPYTESLLSPLHNLFTGHLSLFLHRHLEASDAHHMLHATKLSKRFNIPLIATNDVHYPTSKRQRLQDVLTAIRHRTTVQEAGRLLFSNGERYLKSAEAMSSLFSDFPAAVRATIDIAEKCTFSLDELRYVYPDEFLPPGETSKSYLRKLTYEGGKKRYANGIPPDVETQISHELRLISELNFADYFLTIHDIVTFARSRKILCQGRGSAANSVVCYLLGITAIDPVRMNLLFERFISAERGEPPDIDVDFEHERREEVIQYIYSRYGRERAGIVAEVITYRSRSALRDVTKAVGETTPSPRTLELIEEIKGFPRHLSTHVGGFVLTRDPLIENVPIQNTAMANRTIIQWDKNDLEVLGMLKVDILGLGMLTCIRKCFDLIHKYGSPLLTLESIPAEDKKVYDMICAADTLGVFQIESRAQMGMLPRLMPRHFHDLVVEVAIVRPGPIIGKMVHPYLRRRRGEEKFVYPHPALKEILGKTFGVPLFQEQVMKIAIAVAGFTPGEADKLRRAMGMWRTSRSVAMESMGEKFIAGMKRNGVKESDAQLIFEQVRSFGEFGFPESHSASFALLVYASAYLKCYYPAPFACSLLNSQPMGFYAPHTITDDLKRHGVSVLPIDVLHSNWDCSLENGKLRLGLRLVRGLGERVGREIESARPFRSIEDFVARTSVHRLQAAFLASAGAFDSLLPSRREAIWKLLATPFARNDLHSGHSLREERASFSPLSPPEIVANDYQMTGLSLFAHPLSLLREEIRSRGGISISELANVPNGRRVKVAGLVIVRQRPPTAKGMTFLTLEDESALLNVAVRPNVFDPVEEMVRTEPLLLIEGKLQRDGGAMSLLAQEISPLYLRAPTPIPSRDFH